MSTNTQKDVTTTAPSWPEWYNEKLESIDGTTRVVLEKYSGIPSERVVPHILEIVNLTRIV